MLLERHQVFHRIDTRVDARGDQTGEPAGTVGTRGTFVKEGVVALPEKQLQGALGDIVVERGAWEVPKARQSFPVILPGDKRFPP